MENKKSVIIIGAGISGLSAGCYALMNEYKVQIFEMHNIPGGCCTSWKRGEYVLDECIEWLLGTAHGSGDMNQIWQELGALQGKEIRDFAIFNEVVDTDGRKVKFYVNADKLEEHLLELSPDDRQPIKEFCSGLRRFSRIKYFPFLKPQRLMNIFEIIKMIVTFLPYGKLFKYSEETQMSEFVKQFKDPLLQKAFRYIFFQDMQFPLLPYLLNLACSENRNAGFPEGGSLGFANSITKRFTELGGEIKYNSRVEKILTKEGQAVGIELEDGSRFYAEHVIGACDGSTIVHKMLGKEYMDDITRRLYDELLKKPGMIYPGGVTVFLGVNRDMSREPHSSTYLLTEEESGKLPSNEDQKSLVVQIRTNYSKEFAPAGKSVIYAYYFTDYHYWADLYKNDMKAYKLKKKEMADFIIDYIEELYPGIKEQIEMIDTSSPCTAVRYTGNHGGTIMAWKPFSEAEELTRKMIDENGMKLKNLKNFYMTGHWISLGGVTRSAASGRHVVQYLCNDDSKKFKSLTQKI